MFSSHLLKLNQGLSIDDVMERTATALHDAVFEKLDNKTKAEFETLLMNKVIFKIWYCLSS